MTGVITFAAGYGFDRLLGKMSDFLKTPKKQALLINGAFGLGFGLISALNIHKNNKIAAEAKTETPVATK